MGIELQRAKMALIFKDLRKLTSNVKLFADALLASHDADDTKCKHFLRQYLLKNPFNKKFPLNIGEELSSNEKTQLVLFLVSL